MNGQGSIACMLEARSVAVVGASARPESFGEQMMLQLLRGGFTGAVYPVNPKYDEVMGHRSYPSIGEVPEAVDLAVLGVSNALLEDQLIAAAEAGARSAVIFASCYEAPSEGRLPLRDRLASIAHRAGTALCGGNGMGFINADRGLRACGFSEPFGRQPGPITFISHSGSAFSAMLHNDRGLRFNLVVSSGLEMVTTTDEYMEYALDQPTTRLVALFIETARHPAGFRAALARAAELDVPVVALKVGRTDRAKELVTAHSGALAGEDGAYEALFDAYGVARVDTFDEMADTLELFAAGRLATAGGLAAIHDSGGERAHLIDMAGRTDVPLAQLSEETTKRLEAVLEEGLPAANPLDAWGTGNQADDIFIECMHALLDDPDTGALAFCVDLTTELTPETGYSRVAREVFAGTEKPVAVLGNLASAIDRRDAEFVRAAGVPVLEGTATGLAAFRHLFDRRDFRARPSVTGSSPAGAELQDVWRAKLSSTDPIDEAGTLALLSDYGLPVVDSAVAVDLEGALASAERIGWPVALKTAQTGVAHKSDVGGVKLGLGDVHALHAAYDDLARRLGPRVTVAAMAPPGIELHVGVLNDDQFGPLVLVAAGGILIEALSDRRLALPPIGETRARAMIDRLGVRPLLDGVRGAPPVDVDTLVHALVAVSWLAHDLGDHFRALDVNPLIVAQSGCVAVDALLVRGGKKA
jgi:acyl-CoA synthetase (NDP forming)